MRRSSLTILVFGIVLGIVIGLLFDPLVTAEDHGQVASWLEVLHRITTSMGGVGNFAGLIIVLQFSGVANEHVKKMETKQGASEILPGAAPGGYHNIPAERSKMAN